MTKYFTNLSARLHKSEEGVTAIEYALIAALIAVALIAGATLLGTQINTTFSNVAGQM
jgi:pilus assembly protein Flp/PilA